MDEAADIRHSGVVKARHDISSTNQLDGDHLEPIAVVGFSMRFPQEATSPEAFWEILCKGKSAMTEVPPDRFNINGFYHPNASRPDTINCRGGHFLKDDIAAFDAPFFSVNPSEAESMDPAQRGLLETSYHALENAGIPIQKVAGSKTSVYVASLGVEYSQLFDHDDEIQPQYRATGIGGALLSNRLSWFYDLRGPSMTVETACSGSMVALHLACQSLRAHESSMSLVCGSQLYFEPLTNAISLSTMQFMSSDSRCYSFDHRANGYAKGEGFGVLVLKSLAQAMADGDTIRAVIRSTATNQDGRTPGITQPSLAAQEEQIREAYRAGGLDLHSTRLFESHGTGTALGDPIETEAIGAVFQPHRSGEDPMYVGAVKSNIGHLEAVAGIAGVIKTILCLEKGMIPPNAGFERMNPRIKADEWHLCLPTTLIPWPSKGLRRASVNSFGYGGSNAHVVLDDAYNYLHERHLNGRHNTVERPGRLEVPTANGRWGTELNNQDHINGSPVSRGSSDGPRERHANGETAVSEKQGGKPYIFVWSASEAAGIERMTSTYKEYLSQPHFKSQSTALDDCRDLAYTLSNKRSVLPWKSYLLASSVQDLVEKLEVPPKCSRSSTPPKIHFIFTGQGAQWANMGLELLVFPAFQLSLAQADNHFRSLGSTWSLLEEIRKPAGVSRLDSPDLAQPVCTALQIALLELLETWGVRPWAVAGHSSGEIAAAVGAGAIPREAAWTIAYFRGMLAARLATADAEERGAMMSVQLSEADLSPYFEQIEQDSRRGALSVGCVNSPCNTTVTGLETALDQLKEVLDRDGVFARKLPIPVAYHSEHMQVVAKEYLQLLQDNNHQQSPSSGKEGPVFFSSVTGDVVSLGDLRKPEYWVRNLVSRVRFSEAVSRLYRVACGHAPKNQANYYMEIGPHAVLQRPIKETLSETDDIMYEPTLRRGSNAHDTLSNLAGKLFMGGYPINLEEANNFGSANRPGRMLTDLPKYPFNHSQRYWLESRLFRNYRQRKNIRHELLGLPSTDWNPLRPRWRHTIRSSDLPWVKDHKVNGSVVYPAAGMLAMVIEAARSISKPGLQLRGYRFREVAIINALVLPPESGALEVQLYMQDQKNSRTTGISLIECREFYISSCTGDEWRDVCSGNIVTEYAEESTGIYDSEEDTRAFADYNRARFQKASENCPVTAVSERFYAMGKQVGYDFGPTFQTLQDIKYDPTGQYAVATIVLDDWMAKSPNETSVQDHVIHPTSLDGVLQTVAVLTSKGGNVLGQLQAPTQFRELWISHDLLLRNPEARLSVAAKAEYVAIRDIDASIVALSLETSEPALVIEGYRATALSSDYYMPSERRDIFYAVEWKPDVELLLQSEIEDYCVKKAGSCINWDASKQVVCLYYMTKVLRELERQGFRSSKPHLQKYMSWISHHLSDLGDRNPLLHHPWAGILASEDWDTYIESFSSKGPVERAIYRLCSHLAVILRGEVDPLDLLFNQGLAQDIYMDEIVVVTGKRVAAFVDLLCHKSPGMDILEVGAGTGSATDPILSAISKQQGKPSQNSARYNSYTFTDISPSFFEKAQSRFAAHADQMRFKTLDIEQDPAQQGFTPGSYDLVVAAMVIHTTANIKESLQHVRSLLKPGGRFVLIEQTNKQSTVADCLWGTLPGWWRATEKDRKWTPLYSQEEWGTCLQQTGFTDLELAITDYEQFENHTLSFMVSKAAESPIHGLATSRAIVVSTDSTLQQRIAANIVSDLRSSVMVSSCDVTSPQSFLSHSDDQDILYVSLLELEDSFLSSMSDLNLAVLKTMTGHAGKVYWLTSGGGARARQPAKAMSSGFGRAIRQEHPGLLFATIDVDDPNRAGEAFRRVFDSTWRVTDLDSWDSDYMTPEAGFISIPRVVEANEINSFVHSQTGRLHMEKRSVEKEPVEALKLEFTFGKLESFCFSRDESFNTPLEADEVEVMVKATGINFKDVMVILGQMAGSFIGCEYSGVVSRVGPAVTAFSPGDRVCSVGSSTFRTFVRGREYTMCRIPDSLPFVEANPAAFLTAIYGINHMGRLRRGESILIHTGAGAVGQSAIQVAQHIGADVFITVSSGEKRDLIRSLYGIPDDRVFFSRNLSFGRQIMRATGGRGVDVVLNSLSGESLAESWRVLAPLGRFVELGKRDAHNFQSLPMQPFSKNLSYHSGDLDTFNRHDPGVMGRMVAEMSSLLSAGVLSSPKPVSVFSRADFEPAIRYLQTGRHMGKAVIDWEAQAEIPVIPSPEPEYSFNPNASYVIAGGLGGIGRRLAAWIASRGAKHLILLSRSGPSKSDSAMKLLGDLRARGIHVVTPQCDIADAQSLRDTISRATRSMPPIRGCIQSSMVLKDRLFQNMTKDEWQAVLDPKLSGSWNLHRILPQSMDFFVILSSLGGMTGSSGQSQYNAVSTFQDAFARHRWSLGEKCVSLDIGLVTGVGYVAEHSHIAKRWEQKGLQVLQVEELLGVVDWACNPARDLPLSPWSTQVITAAGRSSSNSPSHLNQPLFRHLLRTGGQAACAIRVVTGNIDYGAMLRDAGSLEEAGDVVAAALSKRLARALSITEEDIDSAKPAHSYGVDSLVAVELRFWFSTEIKADVSVFNILANDSILSLGQLAASKSEHLQKSS